MDLKLKDFKNRNSRAVNLIIIIGVLTLIWHQLSSGIGKNSLSSFINTTRPNLQPSYLLGCILLMPLNWYLEALKFSKIMSPHVKIGVKESIFTVLGGLSIGIVTPGRIGEYAGRLITFDPEYKSEVISSTLLGSIAQNICNIVVGLAFSYFFLKTALNVTYDNSFAFLTGILIQILLFIIIYYNLAYIAHRVEKILPHRWIVMLSTKLKSLDLYQTRVLHEVLGISFIRYVVYFFQYLLIIKFLDVDGKWVDITSNIAGIYMIQTGIPLPAFLSMLARGEVAVLVWSGIGVDSSIALFATFTLWLINLILPSLAGLIVLYFNDIKKYF